MGNLKIKVNNEAERKEAQGLFFELGYKFSMVDFCKDYNSVQVFDDGSGSLFEDHDTCNHKEITLPQLRDMVVLNRNDVNDATHACESKHHRRGYLSSDGVGYIWFYSQNEWLESGKSFNELGLKPIEKEMKYKEFLNTKSDYKLQILPEHAGDDPESGLIEVPEWANFAYMATRGAIVFMNTRNEIGSVRDSEIVWQRPTQPEELPFVDDGPIKSDGGSTDYYKKPIPSAMLERFNETGVIEARDVIRLFLGNDFTRGNIFKAHVRLDSLENGQGKAGIDAQYDLNKIVFFAEDDRRACLERANETQ